MMAIYPLLLIHWKVELKTPIIAAILLALTAPALALVGQPTKKTSDVYSNWDCARGGAETLTEEDHDKACEAEERHIKKMDALGYCVMGHIFIARKGRLWTKKEWDRMGFLGEPNGTHCYKLNPKRDARILRYEEQYEKEQPYVRVRNERCKKNPSLPACGGDDWKVD
jgi:hypothetical protein